MKILSAVGFLALLVRGMLGPSSSSPPPPFLPLATWLLRTYRWLRGERFALVFERGEGALGRRQLLRGVRDARVQSVHRGLVHRGQRVLSACIRMHACIRVHAYMCINSHASIRMHACMQCGCVRATWSEKRQAMSKQARERASNGRFETETGKNARGIQALRMHAKPQTHFLLYAAHSFVFAHGLCARAARTWFMW